MLVSLTTHFSTESLCCGKKKKKILACQFCLLETVTHGFYVVVYERLSTVCNIKGTVLDVDSAV